MPRRTGPILILLSLVLAGTAAWLANRWVNTRTVTTAAAPTTHILVAAMDLPLGTKIEARHISKMEMIAGKEPSGSFHHASEIEGKVAKAPINTGQILMASMFFKPGEGSTLAAIVDPNKRAVTVRVDDVIGVAGFLLPGNRVDVVATRKIGMDQAFSDTILSNIKVLAVDQTAAAANSNEPVVVRAVTLEVTPQQAETLLRCKALGTIQLTLRNPLDHSDARDVPKTAEVVVARTRIRRVVVGSTPAVMVIRGTNVAHDAARE